MPTEFRTCPGCGDLRVFAVPPCLDGHGDDCPERACVDCGAALLVDPPPGWLSPVPVVVVQAA